MVSSLFYILVTNCTTAEYIQDTGILQYYKSQGSQMGRLGVDAALMHSPQVMAPPSAPITQSAHVSVPTPASTTALSPLVTLAPKPPVLQYFLHHKELLVSAMPKSPPFGTSFLAPAFSSKEEDKEESAFSSHRSSPIQSTSALGPPLQPNSNHRVDSQT